MVALEDQGGRILSTLPWPAVPSRMPRSRMASATWFARLVAGTESAVFDQFNAEQQALAPDVADRRVPPLQCPQAVQEIAAHLGRVLDQALVLDDGEDRERGGAGDRVTAERAEQFRFLYCPEYVRIWPRERRRGSRFRWACPARRCPARSRTAGSSTGGRRTRRGLDLVGNEQAARPAPAAPPRADRRAVGPGCRPR